MTVDLFEAKSLDSVVKHLLALGQVLIAPGCS